MVAGSNWRKLRTAFTIRVNVEHVVTICLQNKGFGVSALDFPRGELLDSVGRPIELMVHIVALAQEVVQHQCEFVGRHFYSIFVLIVQEEFILAFQNCSLLFSLLIDAYFR